MVRALDRYSSGKDVAYSCGYCGYALNLSSSTRNTANIGSKYGKHIRKGVVSFFAIDESRFTQIDEVSCTPYFHSSCSWGFFRNRTRLLCQKCSGHIGNAYEDEDPTLCEGSDDLGMSSKGSPLQTILVLPSPHDVNLNSEPQPCVSACSLGLSVIQNSVFLSQQISQQYFQPLASSVFQPKRTDRMQNQQTRTAQYRQDLSI